MKHPASVIALICCSLVLLGGVANAQDNSHVYVVVTWQTIMPEGGTAEDRDALLSEWIGAVLKKNNKILSSKNLRHMYGSNNHDWVVINEYATFADIAEAAKLNASLGKKKWPDEKKRAEFFRRLGEYYPSHSDEIYRALPEFDK